MGNIFSKKFNSNRKSSINHYEVLMIHFSLNHSLLKYIKNSKEFGGSFEKYVTSFFKSTNKPDSIATTHLISREISEDDVLFRWLNPSAFTSAAFDKQIINRYRFFTFGENDETEEFVGSNLKRFSLVIICCDPYPFVFESVYVINSLEAILKDDGVIVASGFEKRPYGSVGKRVIVIQDYP
jgi:hypothetical protein